MEINDPSLKYAVAIWLLASIALAFFYRWKHNRAVAFFNREIRRKEQLRKRIEQINFQLLNIGLSTDEIMEFWEDCMAEALICHSLPECYCQDVNQCDTWCRTKARFSMNPPDEICFMECTSCGQDRNIEKMRTDSGDNWFCIPCYEELAPVMKADYEELVAKGEIESL